MSNLWGDKAFYFTDLGPMEIDQCLERIGIRTSGQNMALNSMENRVYLVSLENDLPQSFEGIPHSPNHLVAKFYRPGRWKKESLKEEHEFLLELFREEIPVIPPITVKGETLFFDESLGIYFSLYPKVRGRLKDEWNKTELETLGKLLAHIHNLGALKKFTSRPLFSPKNYIENNLEVFKTSPLIPEELRENYLTLCKGLQKLIEANSFNLFDEINQQRIHGDFHLGNILWADSQGEQTPFVLDFDDTLTGPPEQDLWPLVSGRDNESKILREYFLESYNQWAINPKSMTQKQIEIFRTLRMIHFDGWILRRFEDPVFKQYFEHVNTPHYWSDQILTLREQWGHLEN